MNATTCFDLFEQCVKAIQGGELIESETEKDKEFHFQNWFRSRLTQLNLNFDESGRNSFPDFRLVNFTEAMSRFPLKANGEVEFSFTQWPPPGQAFRGKREHVDRGPS